MKRNIFVYALAQGVLLACVACSGGYNSGESAQTLQVVPPDTDYVVMPQEEVVEEGMPEIKEEDKLETSQPSPKETAPAEIEITGGVLERMAETAPDYLARLQNNSHNGFVVVDKETMRVLLYDRNGQQKKSYPMACARNYGSKHKKGDNRTPEGFFTVSGVYNSTDWLYTDDNGVTSKTKGVYGPRFIRLNTPVTSSVGIHGTNSPGALGKRVSHGCIRIANQNILDLVQYVEPGMPVIVLPSKRDRQVNSREGYQINSFSTSTKTEEAPADTVVPATVPEPEVEVTDSLLLN